ncbi:Peroxisomal acyl-coenzyme A oxidase 1 [Ananas comosus]|uniref:Peroxisomal acyl-coenzyme A oxidase 1 n=1 Tax=Ananas comosus TaxID=4615 RepID=A0A199UK07_ANACO|nr:Peroxisomal acyl-coenzyme A oxidase 1 [Ananas comosus]
MEEVDHLAQERSRAEFDVEAMKVVWAGSKHALDVADRMARVVASDPVFRKDNRTMLGRKELFKNTLRKAAHAWKRINELRLTEEEASMLRFFVDEPSYVDLHWGLSRSSRLPYLATTAGRVTQPAIKSGLVEIVEIVIVR